ncbi:hypothetical protein, partial [Thalassospira xiamenensis]|uniref:hypothetical protein n=1 Tax=Thalassospira xiamenensis TaxID=220697 RepID=UPI003AA8268F
PVRSVKRDNAENQRARIAPGLDRHGVGWSGLAGRIGCQRADGSFGDAEGPVIDGGICVSAMRQRCCPWGDVCFGATESERRSGQRGPSGAWAVRSVAFGDAGGRGGWLAGWIGLAMDQNRHSGRSAAQTRNPCPVERDWIPAVAGMTIWLGMLCQRSGVGWWEWSGD